MLDQIPTEVTTDCRAPTDGVSSSDMLGGSERLGGWIWRALCRGEADVLAMPEVWELIPWYPATGRALWLSVGGAFDAGEDWRDPTILSGTRV
jgi:hypothetical protein